jgi:hypothetical protein
MDVTMNVEDANARFYDAFRSGNIKVMGGGVQAWHCGMAVLLSASGCSSMFMAAQHGLLALFAFLNTAGDGGGVG